MPASGTSTFIVLCQRYCHVVVMLSVIDFVFCIPYQIDVLCIQGLRFFFCFFLGLWIPAFCIIDKNLRV